MLVFVIWILHFLQTTNVMRFSKVCYSDTQYSGDLKPDHFESILFEGRISNGLVFKCRALAMAIVPSIQKLDHSKTFLSRFNFFLQNGRHLSGFQMVELSDFRSHSKSGPYANQPLFDHSKSRLIQISDPHCKPNWLLPSQLNFFESRCYLANDREAEPV